MNSYFGLVALKHKYTKYYINVCHSCR